MFECFSTIEEYAKLYNDIVSMSMDCDGFGLFEDIGEVKIEKAKFIYAIYSTIRDVPMGRVEHIAEQKIIDFDSEEYNVYYSKYYE